MVPCTDCSLADIPENLQQLFQLTKNKLIVKWIGENTYSSVNCNQIDIQGENLLGTARAAKSKYIME